MSEFCALAFDYGIKNIGVAAGQSITQSAGELTPLKARDGIPNWQQVEQLLKEWQPKLVVVGLPLNMDNSESELSRRARTFGNRLNGRFGVNVEMIDERLSTREAKSIASERGHKGNYAQAPIDSLAAALLLSSWWREQPVAPNHSKPS